MLAAVLNKPMQSPEDESWWVEPVKDITEKQKTAIKKFFNENELSSEEEKQQVLRGKIDKLFKLEFGGDNGYRDFEKQYNKYYNTVENKNVLNGKDLNIDRVIEKLSKIGISTFTLRTSTLSDDGDEDDVFDKNQLPFESMITPLSLQTESDLDLDANSVSSRINKLNQEIQGYLPLVTNAENVPKNLHLITVLENIRIGLVAITQNHSSLAVGLATELLSVLTQVKTINNYEDLLEATNGIKLLSQQVIKIHEMKTPVMSTQSDPNLSITSSTSQAQQPIPVVTNQQVATNQQDLDQNEQKEKDELARVEADTLMAKIKNDVMLFPLAKLQLIASNDDEMKKTINEMVVSSGSSITITLTPQQHTEIELLVQQTTLERLRAITGVASNKTASQTSTTTPITSVQPAQSSVFDEAENKIAELQNEIQQLQIDINQIDINTNNPDEDDLLAKQRELNVKQSTLNQANMLIENAKTARDASVAFASRTNVDLKKELLLLSKAKEECDNIVKDIDAVINQSYQATKANTIIIDPSRRVNNNAQTVLIRNVPDRDKLASDFMEVNKLLPSNTNNTSSSSVISAHIINKDNTTVMFRGQALGPNDVVQYTERLSKTEAIYSEVYRNKAGEAVATDRSVVATEEDMQKAAIIQAENILANYKGHGEIVLTLDTKSGHQPQHVASDLKRLGMLYAAILLCSKRQAFTSYPAIRVVHPEFKVPPLTKLGFTRTYLAENYISKQLGINAKGALTQADMAKQLKNLRTEQKQLEGLMHDEGINRKGKVVESEATQTKILPLTKQNLSQSHNKIGSSVATRSSSVATSEDDSTLHSVDDEYEDLDSVIEIESVTANGRPG